MTEWRNVPGFGRYCVSEAGEVRGRFGRLMRLEQLKGYLTLKVWTDDDCRVRVGVHQLVALAFVGPRPTPLHEVAHWDGVRANNSASNLRWATAVENAQDRITHGTHPAGERHPRARLSEAQVASIRARYTGAPGEGALLAAEFGVVKSHIRHIARGWRWSSGEATRPEASAHQPAKDQP